MKVCGFKVTKQLQVLSAVLLLQSPLYIKYYKRAQLKC